MGTKKKASKPNSPNKFGILLAVGILIIGLVIVYSKIHTSKNTPNQKVNEEKTTLVGLSDYLKANAEPRKFGYDDWIEDDKRHPLIGEQILLGAIGTNGVGGYGDSESDDLNMINDKFLVELQGKISTYFINNGFRFSEDNTNLIAQEYYFSTLGFEKGNIKCLSHVAKQSDPFGYITCGTINKEQLALQEKLINVEKEQQNAYQGPIIFRVDKVQGDFAVGSTGSAGGAGGNQWIAKNIQGAWSTVWAGQDFPLCPDMAKYEVPKDLYPGCYNPETMKEQRTY